MKKIFLLVAFGATMGIAHAQTEEHLHTLTSNEIAMSIQTHDTCNHSAEISHIRNIVTGHEHHNNHEGKPCPCTRYKCDCGSQLVYSATAYKVDVGECKQCKGTGVLGNSILGYSTCGYCNGTGRETEWRDGCVCKSCGNVYEQPDDCE